MREGEDVCSCSPRARAKARARIKARHCQGDGCGCSWYGSEMRHGGCQRRASPLACLAASCLVLGYSLFGGFLFLALESSPSEDTAVAASQPDLSQAGVHRLTTATVQRLWAITEDLNILYKDNWTRLAAAELMDFQRVLLGTVPSGASPALAREGEYRRTFAGSFLYALTLITTIGPGHSAPSSPLSRAAALVYAIFGIPVVMVYLSTVGRALGMSFRRLYGRMRLRKSLPPPQTDRQVDRQTPFQTALNLGTLAATRNRWCSCRDGRPMPVTLGCAPIVLYVALGSVIFHVTEKWSILDGCYFSLCSLATIGWGDLKPGLHARSVSPAAEDAALGLCCGYILVGMVVVAMCFDVVREELQWRGRVGGGGGVEAGAWEAPPPQPQPAPLAPTLAAPPPGRFSSLPRQCRRLTPMQPPAPPPRSVSEIDLTSQRLHSRGKVVTFEDHEMLTSHDTFM